jgi:hypothetical protein
MADDHVRILFCLIHGETTLFQVKATVGDSVTRLKELIFHQKPNDLPDAKELTLYLVNSLNPTYCHS